MRNAMSRGVAQACAAGLGAAGRGGAVRPAGRAAGGGPHRAPAGRQPAHRRSTRPERGATRAATTTSRCGWRPSRSVPSSWRPGCRWSVGEQVLAQALVKALWSDDDGLTTRINPAVAHYTGQAELAQVIQEGLAAKAAGDTATATTKLGRAVQLAEETGNDEATTRLRKVVEIEDPATGTVRLRRNVDKLDEMALDTSSTKTTRVKR